MITYGEPSEIKTVGRCCAVLSMRLAVAAGKSMVLAQGVGRTAVKKMLVGVRAITVRAES